MNQIVTNISKSRKDIGQNIDADYGNSWDNGGGVSYVGGESELEIPNVDDKNKGTRNTCPDNSAERTREYIFEPALAESLEEFWVLWAAW